MLNIVKKSFYILKNNLIFIQPLLLFLLIFMTALSYILNRGGMHIPQIILCIAIILMIIAFSAGWFFINKEGIILYNPEDDKDETAKKAVQSFKKFFEGVGADFLKIMGGYIILAVIFTGLMYLSAKFCTKVFGEPKFIYELQKIAAAQSQAQVLNSLNTVSTEDKLAFSGWVLVFNFISSIFNYFVLLYVAAIEFSNSNIISFNFKYLF